MLGRREFVSRCGLAGIGLGLDLLRPRIPSGWPVQASCLRTAADGSIRRVPGKATALYQKTAIIFDGRQEVMVLRSMYEGEGDLFGCFGPTPVDSRIKPVSRDLFDSIDSQIGQASFASLRDNRASLTNVRSEDIYNLELFRSVAEIRGWFDRNGFALSPKVREIVDYYFARRNIFFGALIPYGQACDGTQARVWTPPVQSAFQSDRIWFPMKSSTAGSGDHAFVSFDLLTLGKPLKIPAMYDVVFRGAMEIGHRRYDLTRLEARLTFQQMEEDLEIMVDPRRPSSAW